MKGENLTPPDERPDKPPHCALCPITAPPIADNESIVWQRGWWLHFRCANRKLPHTTFIPKGDPDLVVPNAPALEPSPSQVIDEIAEARKTSELRERRLQLEASLIHLDGVIAQMRDIIKKLDDLGA